LPLRPGPFKFQPKDTNRTITSLRPTGRVFYQDDLSILRWELVDIVGAGALSLDTAYVRAIFAGGGSLRLTTGTSAGNMSQVFKSFYLPTDRNIGFEGILTLHNIAYIRRVKWVIYLQYPDMAKEFHVNWQIQDYDTWKQGDLWIPAPHNVKIGSLTPVGWHPFYFKLTVNGDEGKYKNFYLDDLEIPLEKYRSEDVAGTFAHTLNVYIRAQAHVDAASARIHLADPIITIEEP